jgi:lipopolysaccharide/colanic/teichoic acid biosynthesis glycosyltransferase
MAYKIMTYYPYIKRILDVCISLVAVTFLLPLLIIIAILISADSKGPPFFIQKRIGKEMRPFNLIKFRSMINTKTNSDLQFDPGDNSRVTKVGKILRETKVDEILELINVLVGDMSLVGPRPEVQQYVEDYIEDFKKILMVRPGITDLASLKYRNEESILELHGNPDTFYRSVILPDKLFLAKKYIRKISFITDLRILFRTVAEIFKVSN